MAQITYANKEFINENANIPAINKVQDTDLNEIKSVVNGLVSDTYSTDTEQSYSCNYINNSFTSSRTSLPVVSSSTVTYNNSFYVKIGNIIFVNISDVLIPNNLQGNIDLLKNAPAPASDVAFQILRQDGKVVRLHVGTDGIIRTWYANGVTGSGTYYWYGFVCYTI